MDITDQPNPSMPTTRAAARRARGEGTDDVVTESTEGVVVAKKPLHGIRDGTVSVPTSRGVLSGYKTLPLEVRMLILRHHTVLGRRQWFMRRMKKMEIEISKHSIHTKVPIRQLQIMDYNRFHIQHQCSCDKYAFFWRCSGGGAKYTKFKNKNGEVRWDMTFPDVKSHHTFGMDKLFFGRGRAHIKQIVERTEIC